MAMDKNKGKSVKASQKKQVTSKNYETGMTTFPSGLPRRAGGYKTGSLKTATNKSGKINQISAAHNTPAKKKKK